MKAINAPARLQIPFGSGSPSNYNNIPVASQIGITNGAASFTDGFPPNTRKALAAGGIWPDGLDMNGILFDLSAVDQWKTTGGQFTYDATFATAIGGYPKGAALLMVDLSGLWISTVDDNTTNPDTGGANWIPLAGTGFTSQALSNVNVTLTAPQYSKQIIVLTGVLTANVQVMFPNIPGRYLVVNNTTGAFTVTAKVTGGAGVGVGLMVGPNLIYPLTDGSDMNFVVTGVASATQSEVNAGTKTNVYVAPATLKFGFATAFSTAKSYIKFPQWLGSILIQWGRLSISGDGSSTVSGLQPYTSTSSFAVFVSGSNPNSGKDIQYVGADISSTTAINLDYDSFSGPLFWLTIGT